MHIGLTTGQAAAFADVTVKTVRHYHRLGLVDEPERDASGYRRYGSQQLLQLVRVRTLARAGVPLAEIPALLEADPDQFATAIVDIDQRLSQHIAELTARRVTLHRLENGDRALLPDRACALLDRLRELDLGPKIVDAYRDSLILAKALFPDHFDDYLTDFETAMADSVYAELIRQCWEADDWHTDDPRIPELAEQVADHLLRHPELTQFTGNLAAPDGATRYGVINHHGQQQPSTSARLTALIEQRLRAGGVDIPRQ
ncbi:MerR family transcriptional regulator [Nocardia mexicana]|uniref:DNA-binding transcriptional MerR regulator n=1 Tax=Nocardia mexicana TaxID=279262 RepID=A0A370HC24_9NOCA|nr:MerR family transcriptional regulator [Nocardia mexicana]RDI54469.1 DNA-binding transcriptional MerR regulator [Nocardia mexicana]